MLVAKRRTAFVGMFLMFSVAAAIHAAPPQGSEEEPEGEENLQTVRDILWVWGMPKPDMPGEPTLADFLTASPAQKAALLGVSNIVMAGSGLPDDEELGQQQTKDVSGLGRLVWETRPDGKGIGPPFVYSERLAQVRKLAAKYPQIQGVLLDDMSTGKIARGFKAEHIRHMRKLLAGSKPAMKVWGVVYSMSFGREGLTQCIQELDVINLWVWHAKDLTKLEEYIDILETKFPGKPIVLGLYLYDYGNGRRIPQDLLELQFNTALKLARAGRIQGIVVLLTLHNDTEATTWTADWIKRVGDQEIPIPRHRGKLESSFDPKVKR